ncbi:histidine kinase [Streptomyces hirsutus]|uniref:histidine kinase n=1 Tax=Streptomyces hirsutus TaxID=35620 RepID=A0ABZ1GVF3_9ACTN|nr:histidine kinase [Streptomyces hirsutus]WSD08738.1 histidine kinase [Streptomyces hirsutus]WTD17807.1 histidine kinase [Streptomyces hirsutus]WTD77318.1 histidine kinase [Streptomyces sp. NBC_01635]
MKRTDDRFLPVLLICAQALVWPGAALVRGAVPSAGALLVAVLVAVVVTAALVLRRNRPVVALLVVVAACALGAGPLPAGATAVLGTAGVGLALFTVAARRDAFTAVLCVLALAVWQPLYNVSLHGISSRDGLHLALTVLLYAAACGAGVRVRRARRARRAAERLRQRTEAERHRLPAVERRRMERELHDVSAHHLTAVVVTAGAALGLRDRRPELVEEALDFAVGTGREVTRALSAVRAPAPSREDVPSPEERLQDLVAGFRRLDQRVDCEIDPLPDGAVADAAYGIVREALTNVARHAPGARTTVRVRYGDTGTDVAVTSSAPPAGAAAHGAGLGGGRGQGFLRSRAREAGGTLVTGPTAEGGWEVRAALPGRTGAPVERSVPRGYRLAQLTAAFGLVVQPTLPMLVLHRGEVPEPGDPVSAGVFFGPLAVAQAVALLWLRRSPRAARGALLALVPLWPVAMSVGHYTGPVLFPLALSLPATCAALAADAARRAAAPSRAGARPPHTDARVVERLRDRFVEIRPPHARAADTAGPSAVGTGTRSRLTSPATWPVRRLLLPVAAVAVHAGAATAAVLDRGTTLPVVAVVAGTTAATALVAGASRWAGSRRGRRERAARGAHQDRLVTWTEEAVRDAWAERRRIAAGLETTVLSRTADMVAEAEAGRLDATADRAREALAAMRALLDAVRDGEAEPALRPQPTLQALDLLAHQCRATGRDVEIRLTGRVPARLPTAVDLAAYHAAETVLAIGGDEPAVVELDADADTLTLTATGVPDTADTAADERLATRVTALGGTLTTGPRGTVQIRLPLAGAPDIEEGQR